MAQGFMAGATSYDDQSLSDIKEDILRWIEYSKEIIQKFEVTIKEIEKEEFFKKVPFDYKCMISGVPQICRTNIEDFSRTLNAIENHRLTKEIVELFRKIGIRALTNNDENKRCYRSNDERWHDYDDLTFKKIEELYADFGDYTATLWDVTNAASRLMDYIDIPEGVTAMKIENNSINIGDKNKIKNSKIGSKNTIEQKTEKESFPSKVFWQIFIPIVVGVIVVAICVWLGIQK